MVFRKIYLFIHILLLASAVTILGCGIGGPHDGDDNLANKKTSFSEIRDFNRDRVGIVVNLVGAHTGFGDITGPFWTLLELKKLEKYKNLSSVVILDDYSFRVMNDLYHFSDLNTFSSQMGISFISPRQARVIQHSDYILELFSVGRGLQYQKNHWFRSADTTVVMSDPMHSTVLDYVEKGNINLYFNPPGIGSEKNGLVNNPDIEEFINSNSLKFKKIASARFSDVSMKQIILNEGIFRDAKLGFLYGAHNTRKSYEDDGRKLVGQTNAFLQALKTTVSPLTPMIVLTPNTRDILEELLGNDMKVWSIDELNHLSHLENETYLVTIGAISGYQFAGLIASSDLPVLVEGNSAISTAISLKKPFLIYKSKWNWPQIEDIIKFEEKELGTSHFANSYEISPYKMPDFDGFLKNFILPPGKTLDPSFSMNIFFSVIKNHVPDFSKNLDFILNLPEKIETADRSNNKEKEYIRILDSIKIGIKDISLEYSFIQVAAKHRAFRRNLVRQLSNDLESRGVDVQNLKTRFKNKPGL